MNSSETAPKVEPARHWINGEWMISSTVAKSVSPSTGEVLGQYSAGGRTEAASAIAAARRAFDAGGWSHDPQLRSRALLELADRLDERADAIALTISRKGVIVNGYTQVETPDNLIYLDDARMTPLWEALTALDVPLYLHPRASHRAVMYDNHPDLTGAPWGFAPKTARHALRIVYSGIFDRFPSAKLLLGHLGKTLPFLAWRIQHGIDFSPNGRFTKKRLVDYRAENIWVTTSGNFNTQALHCTILTMGAPIASFSRMTTRTRIMPRAENSSIRYRSARATVARSLTRTPRLCTCFKDGEGCHLDQYALRPAPVSNG